MSYMAAVVLVQEPVEAAAYATLVTLLKVRVEAITVDRPTPPARKTRKNEYVQSGRP